MKKEKKKEERKCCVLCQRFYFCVREIRIKLDQKPCEKYKSI